MKKLVLAGVLVLTGCSSSSHTATAPTAVEMTQTGSVSVGSSVTAQQTGSMSACPAIPPFTATVSVVVASGSLNLFVNSIDFRFVDPFGVQMPPVTFPAPVLTAEFGSNLVAARSSRRFSVPFRFGCSTDRRGTLFMIVRTTDANGGSSVRNLTVDIH